MEYIHPVRFSVEIDRNEYDYDDTPLFTREPSYRFIGQWPSKLQFPVNKVHGDSNENNHRKVADPRHRRCVSFQAACLPFLDTGLFATILEDILIQFRILATVNYDQSVLKVKSNIDQLRGKKYGVKPPKVKDEFDGIDVKQLHSEHHKLNKIINDRKICNRVLKDTYRDVTLSNSFCSLIKHRTSVLHCEAYYLQQIEEEALNKIKRREARKNLRQHRNLMKRSIHETDALLNDLISRLEDSTLQKEARVRYMDRWHIARSEQNMWRIHNKEAGPSEAIAYYRRKCEDEQRVHLELETLVNIQYNETLRLIEDTMAKYDTDIETIDLQIQRMRKKLEDQVDTRVEMEQRLADHEQEMNKWIKFKDERERARLYREKMINSAIVVQAWWRGLLVRLQLGPYKPAKRPPAKDKKKKK